MRIFFLIIAFNLFVFNLFGQWKSYYPEKDVVSSQDKNNDKDNFEFNSNFFAALKAKSLEDYEASLKFLEKCIKIDQNQPAVYYELCLINTELGAYDLAAEQIKKAVELNEDNKWYLLKYAELLFSVQDFDQAADQYKKLIKRYPLDKEMYFILADIYIYTNELAKAIKTYNELEKIIGIDKLLCIQKYKLYLQLNNKNKAIKELTELLILYPEDIEIMEYLAEVYLLNNQQEKAFTIFKKIAVLSPENGRIHLTLADYYRQKGELEQSYGELKKAFKSSRLAVETKLQILISYYDLVNIDVTMSEQAKELSDILIFTHPEEIKINAIYGDILYAQGRFLEAKEQYLIFLEQDKTEIQVWIQVLFIQAEHNDFQGLLETSQEALNFFPTEPLFYYFHGISNKRFKNYNEALSSFNMGIEFIIDNTALLLEFYSSLGDIYNSLKKHDLSDSFYEKALEVDSNNAVVLNNYAYYLSLRKVNLENALEMSKKSNQLNSENGTYQDTYAWILYKMEQYEEAKKWILKALNNGSSESPVVVEHYGDILYKLGEEKDAIIQWKNAKKLGEASDFLDKKIKEGKLYE